MWNNLIRTTSWTGRAISRTHLFYQHQPNSANHPQSSAHRDRLSNPSRMALPANRRPSGASGISGTKQPGNNPATTPPTTTNTSLTIRLRAMLEVIQARSSRDNMPLPRPFPAGTTHHDLSDQPALRRAVQPCVDAQPPAATPVTAPVTRVLTVERSWLSSS
jgi:hypothetical protein